MAGALSPPGLSQERYLWLSRIWFSLLGVLAVQAQSIDDDWTYQYQNLWGRDFRNCQQGYYQSPIDIIQQTTMEDEFSGPLVFGPGYMVKPEASTVLNNGHTALVTVRTKGKATVSGGPLPLGHFKFEQLHFHWGKNDSVGSEHTLDGRRFPLELHMVHYNEAYRSFQKAAGKKDGIVVLATWFDVKNDDHARHSAVQPIINSLAKTLDMGDTSRIKTQNRLFDFLPKNKGSYVYYTGSLTTPPCSENVHWVIYTTPQGVTTAQMKAFRRLKEDVERTGTEIPLDSNFRNLQPLHQRAVHRVIIPADHNP